MVSVITVAVGPLKNKGNGWCGPTQDPKGPDLILYPPCIRIEFEENNFHNRRDTDAAVSDTGRY